jgi:hypothetical protein
MAAEKEPKAPAPEPPFLANLTDTADLIAGLRVELEAVEAQRRGLDAQANDIRTKIEAFATLRQAHGLPPV